MGFTEKTSLFAAGLFLGMLLLLEAGRRLGARRLARDPEGARTGIGAVEGSVFGLLGLLLAFTFSGAAERFEKRRHLVVEEANAIGTAWLRLDFLPEPPRGELRAGFRRYLDARLATYRALPDLRAAEEERARSIAIQEEIWARAVAAAGKVDPPQAVVLLHASLNEMFDIATTRTMAARTHPPTILFGMLAVLALVGALLVGYGMAGGRRRGWIHMLAFAGFMALTVFVIIDLEYPRFGFIRVDSFDQVLVDLRRSMDEGAR